MSLTGAMHSERHLVLALHPTIRPPPLPPPVLLVPRKEVVPL